MAEYLDALGYEFSLPVDTNIIFIDLKKMGIAPSMFESHCKQRGLNVFATGRIVFHHQISTDGISRLREAMLDLITSVKRPGYKSLGRSWGPSYV
ncbi:uncharacterized protein LDX57_013072 [Aspergillus melleus]|uniref:uncharacterized protein n=1 Tax=Aspergillus melleus TaxID=138277 RepID=UPI001E8EEB44|nr:uncharacterized protein LDX57_013072 [Aspergillus melleus]KAH8432747.1 hypothetical protein LDX57_013072 [Aspergillus melleus]